MRILLITDLYPINTEDTTISEIKSNNISKVLFYFVKEWQKCGHLVEVICPNFIINTYIRGRRPIKEKIYNENGIKIYNLNFLTPFFFNVRNKLPKEFSLNDYDIMISHMPCGALMAQRLLESEKIRYICGVHASDIVVLSDIKYAVYFRKKLKNSYLSADKIAVRSPVLQQKIEKLIPQIQDKTFVAYSGLDFDIDITNKEQVRNFDYETLRICTVSSLIKRKNIDIIIKALSKLRYNFVYTIIGEGKERKRLEKLAKNLGIKYKIHFIGQISREEVLKTLAQNDIFVLLSDNETFGLAYLESLAMGNIVIAKKNDGIDGILQDGQNSFLINTDINELIECLEKIFSLKETDINKIRNNAKELGMNMSMKKAAENYLDFLTCNS